MAKDYGINFFEGIGVIVCFMLAIGSLFAILTFISDVDDSGISLVTRVTSSDNGYVRLSDGNGCFPVNFTVTVGDIVYWENYAHDFKPRFCVKKVGSLR